MGVKVVDWDGTTLRLEAPLANNINHQQSAFGGSLFSLAALAGWGLVQLKLSETNLDCSTVIAGGDVNYALPVYGDLICVCDLPENWPDTADRLVDKGKASLRLAPTIVVDGQSAMAFNGHYVIRTR